MSELLEVILLLAPSAAARVAAPGRAAAQRPEAPPASDGVAPLSSASPPPKVEDALGLSWSTFFSPRSELLEAILLLAPSAAARVATPGRAAAQRPEAPLASDGVALLSSASPPPEVEDALGLSWSTPFSPRSELLGENIILAPPAAARVVAHGRAAGQRPKAPPVVSPSKEASPPEVESTVGLSWSTPVSPKPEL